MAGWLKIRAPVSSNSVLAISRQLDRGEAEALSLAMEMPHSLLLIDESEGREVGGLFRIDCTGTVGVLLRARKSKQLPSLKPVLDASSQQHIFRLSRSIYNQILSEIGEAR